MEHIFKGMWGSKGSGDSQFSLPYGIAVDSDGNVYVVDFGNSRIQKFTNKGIFLAKWGSHGTGNGQFRSQVGIAVDSNDDIYIADGGNDRVQKFTRTGDFIPRGI